MTNGGQPTLQAYMQPVLYTQVTSLGSAVGLGTIPDGAKLAVIQAEAQNVRYRDDGTNPTTGAGMILVANDILFYTGNFSAIKFIEVTATAKLNVTFYK